MHGSMMSSVTGVLRALLGLVLVGMSGPEGASRQCPPLPSLLYNVLSGHQGGQPLLHAAAVQPQVGTGDAL
jgi:hypothetical protein